MRVRRFILLCLMIFISLCACKKQSAQPVRDSTNTQANKQASSESVEQHSVPIQSSLRISEYLCSVTDISDEWVPGHYLAYGTDFNDSSCYGILDTNGGFSLLNDYAAYFPLADGNLLVTDDANDVERSFRTASHETTDIPLGKIIAGDGTVLFEAAENQRMHIINSKTVMIVEASSGFNGTSIQFGLLDHRGNWIQNLRTNDQLSSFLKEYIEFSTGTKWNYASAISIVCCDGYDGLESQSLGFYKDHRKSNYPVLIYSLYSNSFFEMISYDRLIIQASENEWLLRSTGWANVPWGGDSWICEVYDSNGQKVDSFKNYHSTINGVRYWNDYKWETSVDENNKYTETEYLIIGSDLNQEGYTFSSDYSQKIYRIAGFTENQVWLVARGSDGRMYFVSHDMEGNTVVEPYLLDGFVGGYTTVIENKLICYDSKESFSLYILDSVSDSLIVCNIGIKDYPENIWSMGNGMLALEFHENGNDYIFVYTLDGRCVYQSIV